MRRAAGLLGARYRHGMKRPGWGGMLTVLATALALAAPRSCPRRCVVSGCPLGVAPVGHEPSRNMDSAWLRHDLPSSPPSNRNFRLDHHFGRVGDNYDDHGPFGGHRVRGAGGRSRIR